MTYDEWMVFDADRQEIWFRGGRTGLEVAAQASQEEINLEVQIDILIEWKNSRGSGEWSGEV